ncbi:hypothetical protein EDC48_103250 [Gibbsiella quercinecans]|nr:hypothetical protein EDC48_103250 [Gibbsiella quercinecans]
MGKQRGVMREMQAMAHADLIGISQTERRMESKRKPPWLAQRAVFNGKGCRQGFRIRMMVSMLKSRRFCNASGPIKLRSNKIAPVYLLVK